MQVNCIRGAVLIEFIAADVQLSRRNVKRIVLCRISFAVVSDTAPSSNCLVASVNPFQSISATLYDEFITLNCVV